MSIKPAVSQQPHKPKKLYWAIALLILGAWLYQASPIRSYRIYIDAQPMGEQRFRIVTNSSRASFHGRDVKRVAEGFVDVNTKQRITLDSSRTHWFGSLSVTVYHPEYFYEVVGIDGWFLSKSITLRPTAWSTALSKEPRWLLEYPKYEDRTEAFIASRQDRKTILLSDVHYHIAALSSEYLSLYLDAGINTPLCRSISEVSKIVSEMTSRLYSAPTYGIRNVKFHKDQIIEIHTSLADVRDRLSCETLSNESDRDRMGRSD